MSNSISKLQLRVQWHSQGATQAIKERLLAFFILVLLFYQGLVLSRAINHLGLRSPGCRIFHFKMETDLGKPECVDLSATLSPKRIPDWDCWSSSRALPWSRCPDRPLQAFFLSSHQLLFSVFPGWGLNQRGRHYKIKRTELKIEDYRPSSIFYSLWELGQLIY